MFENGGAVQMVPHPCFEKMSELRERMLFIHHLFVMSEQGVSEYLCQKVLCVAQECVV